MYINGLSQGGSGNTTQLIELYGGQAGGDGLSLQGSNCTVSGLIIEDFNNGISIDPNSNNNTIGGTAAGAGNVISGNSGDGVLIGSTVSGSVASGNQVLGNYIGTNTAGTAALANSVGVEVACSVNTIGGTTSGARNIISGNTSGNIPDGVLIDSTASGVIVQGNYIGTDVTGANALPNGFGLYSYGSNNTIGGTVAGAGNVISGNNHGGIITGNPFVDDILIQGNYIGTNAAGTSAVPNNTFGIQIGGSSMTIGGTVSAARNVISGNSGDGVILYYGAYRVGSNQVLGNYIGTNAAGTSAVPNSMGIVVTGYNNIIGGTASGAYNVISGNSRDGVLLDGDTGTVVQGNYIGINTAAAPLGNSGNGVEVGYYNDTIGGTALGARNYISGNSKDGVLLDSNATGNVVQGDFIGTNVAGTASLANSIGVEVSGSNNLVGGPSVSVSGSRNLISGNTGDGVLIRQRYLTSILVCSKGVRQG